MSPEVPQQPHILLDIEALGLNPGAAITEIGAVVFNIESGRISDTFHRLIQPKATDVGDMATLQWHAEQGTWPRAETTDTVDLRSAMVDFSVWARNSNVETFWSWGASFDFAHLDTAFRSERLDPPWRYSRCQCARTIWNLAFPTTKASKKPHHSLEDAKISVLDLSLALSELRSHRQK